MAQVKLNLARRTPTGKVTLSKTMEEMMTNNANFTTPDPPLTQLVAKYQALDAAITSAEAARAASVEATNLMVAAEKDLDATLTALGSYIQKTSGGDAAKILSAGVDIKSAATPITELPAVQNFSISAGDNDGEIDGGFDPIKGAKGYEIQSCADPITPTGWMHRDVVSKSKFTITGLTSGTRLWFRVRALGPKNIKGAWSDPAVKVVP